MNYKMMGKFVAQTLFVEMLFMLPALGISMFCRENRAVLGFLITVGILLVVQAVLFFLCKGAP